MKYVYLLILCILIALIISFKSYKSEAYSSLSKKDAPLKLLYGFSMVLLVLISKLLMKNKLDFSKEKLTNQLKSVSFGICSFTIIIFFGFLYTFTSSDSNETKKNATAKEQPSLSVDNVTSHDEASSDSEAVNDSSIVEDENYNKIKNTISTFENYRESIEEAFLNGNESYLSVTKPLNLISEIGEEKILISWSFEQDDVIDENGNIIYENISSDGCSTLAYADLSLDDVTATLTIPIFICPP